MPMLSPTRSRLLACLSIAFAAATAMSCYDSVAPSAIAPQSAEALSRSIGATVVGSAARRFAFLSPIGGDLTIDGVFDRALEPVVEVCEWLPTNSCGAPAVVRFTTGSNGIRVTGGANRDDDDRRGNDRRDDDRHNSTGAYSVEWRTRDAALDPAKVYRLRVLLGDTELGHADMRFAQRNGGGRRDGNPAAGASDTLRFTPGSTLPIKFWIEKPPQRLTVQMGDGVRGWPLAQDTTYSYGKRLGYAFLPAKGYEHVEVTLNGNPVPPVGIVRMDTTQVLFATADRRVELPAGTEALYSLARAVLTSADPVAAYQQYLNAVAAYADGMDPDTASRRLGDIGYLAFDPIRDMEAMVRVDAALGGRSFSFGEEPQAASTGFDSASIEELGPQREPATFMYVNGVNTAMGDAGPALNRLEVIIRSMPEFANESKFLLRLVYNHTYTKPPAVPQTTDELKSYCFGVYLSRLEKRIIGENSLSRFMSECTRSASSSWDLTELVRQVWNIGLDTDQALPDAGTLAQQILVEHNKGRHVILVPHSQGTLMANQAIHRLREVTGEWSPSRDSTCIAAVPLAAPTSRRWEEILPERALFPILINGDIVQLLSENQWDPIETEYSKELGGFLGNHLKRSEMVRLHFVTESYMSERGAASKVREGLRSVYGACVVRGLTAVPSSLSMQQGQSRTAGATPRNEYGEALFGRRLQWFSSNPGVASVFASGPQAVNVSGIAAGLGSISAHSGISSVTIPVTVTPKPLAIFPSTYLASVPAGWGGDVKDCSDFPTPTRAKTIELRFMTQFNQETILVIITESNGGQGAYTYPYIPLPGLPQGVDIRGNTALLFQVRWSEDKMTLSGNADHQILRCSDGARPLVKDAISFARQP